MLLEADRVSLVSNNEPESLATVVGRNCKRIRTELGATQDELARHARQVGLRWTSAKVSDFESARRASVSFETVLAISFALELLATSRRQDRAVTLAHLVGETGKIALTERSVFDATTLYRVCTGGRWKTPTGSQSLELPDPLRRYLDQPTALPSGLAEDRVLKRLHLTQDQLDRLSGHLWGRSFTDERDRRAGPDANAQRRGRVARALQTELEEQIADGNH